jgi:hypothetical protein
MTTSILTKSISIPEERIQTYAPSTQGVMISPGYFKQDCITLTPLEYYFEFIYKEASFAESEEYLQRIYNSSVFPWGNRLPNEQVCTVEYVPPQYEILPEPPIPPITGVTDSGAGWDAGAKTIAVYPYGFYFRFSFGSGTVNTYVGLNAGQDKSTLPSEIPIAVDSNRGVLTLRYPGGEINLGFTGNQSSDNEVVFTRDRNNIVRATYKKDGDVYPVEVSPGVEWEYLYPGVVHLEASIYMNGNQVILSEHYGIFYAPAALVSTSSLFLDPTKATSNIISNTTVLAGLGVNEIVIYLRSALVTTSSMTAEIKVAHRLTSNLVSFSSIQARFIEGGNSVLPYLESMGANYFYAASESQLPFLSVRADASTPTPSIIVGITSLAYLQGFGTSKTGTAGRVEATLRPLVGGISSDRPMAQGITELPYLESDAMQIDAVGEASYIDGVFDIINDPNWEATDSIVDEIDIQTQLSVVKEAYASILSQIDTNVNPVVILVTDSSAISTIIITVSDQTESADTWASWVVNYETDAHWRYENFEYNSFATFNGKTYGCKADGVYELSGDTDAGTAIDAKITTPVSDFDNSFKKRMLKAYLGVKSDGDMVLKVLAEGGNVYYYGVDNTRSSVGGARVNIGRGLTSRYWQFELMNSDGADFELDAIEFFPVITSRREM